jgi:periplasmic divalent cation tolerance protein
MTEYIVVMTTVDKQEQAGVIGQVLIDKRLAACVNVIPGITSYYRWGGAAQTGKELMLMIKTRRDKYDEVIKAIKEHHSYEVPEIIAVPVSAGDESYLRWFDESCCDVEEDA